MLHEGEAILTLERTRNPSHGPFVRRTSGSLRAGVGLDACRPSSRWCAHVSMVRARLDGARTPGPVAGSGSGRVTGPVRRGRIAHGHREAPRTVPGLPVPSGQRNPMGRPRRVYTRHRAGRGVVPGARAARLHGRPVDDTAQGRGRAARGRAGEDRKPHDPRRIPEMRGGSGRWRPNDTRGGLQ